MCADEYKWSLSFSSDCKENLFDSESCNVRKQCSAAPTLTPVTVVQCRHARDVLQCNLYLYFPAFVHHKFVSGREDLGDQTENLGDQREEDWAVSWGGPKLFLTKISPKKYMYQKYFWKNIYEPNAVCWPISPRGCPFSWWLLAVVEGTVHVLGPWNFNTWESTYLSPIWPNFMVLGGPGPDLWPLKLLP